MAAVPIEYYSYLWYFELSKNILIRAPQSYLSSTMIKDLWEHGFIDEPSFWSSGLTDKGRAAKMKYYLLK